jgi:predicted flap endonuclease-1-like 5' DNA nuclease
MKRTGGDHADDAVGAPMPDASLPDEVVLEEGAEDDDGAVGLELDARQATEIRQIFLATLPDYLEPIRQMVDQLVSAPAGDGDVQVTLTKTLSSMADAARRVGVEEAQHTLEVLRDDVLLFSDPSEEREALTRRIAEAMDQLSAMAGAAPAGARSESIVSALRGVEGIGPEVLEKLLGAGLVSVDRILAGDPDEVQAVSGLDRATVERVFRALRRAPDVEREQPPPAPPDDAPREPEIGQLLEAQVDLELRLEDDRGRLLRLRIRIRELRKELAAAELRREELHRVVAEAKQAVVGRLATLARAEAARDELERTAMALSLDLERLASRVADLEGEQRQALEDDARTAEEVGALARRVDGVLRSLQTSDASRRASAIHAGGQGNQ